MHTMLATPGLPLGLDNTDYRNQYSFTVKDQNLSVKN